MQLYIHTPGTYLHVREAMFEVRIKQDGQVSKRQFAAHKVNCILLSKGAALSTDAIALAVEHNVDILFLQHDGHPYGRVWHAKHGSTTRIRKRQLEASLGAEGLEAIKTWLSRKLDNQQTFLRDLKKHRSQLHPLLDEKAEKIADLAHKIQSVTGVHCGEVAESLRGWEGTAGRLYFEALSVAIPDAFAFKGRSSRPAQDAFNACLNYAYGILYGQVEKALIVAGLDPYVGFLHRDDYNHKSLVYDFIEPYRIHADRAVFRLFSGKKFNQSYVDAIPNGVSLNAEGKPVLVSAFLAYFQEDKVRYKGRNLTRQHAMQLDAHQFANGLIKQEEVEDTDPLSMITL